METEDEVRRLTVDEIGLLREIARWRRNHGVSYFQWRRTGRNFGAFTEWNRREDKRRINVAYEPGSESRYPCLSVTSDYKREAVQELPVRTVTEAVDCLVALGYLPQRFSSAYGQGWHAAGVWKSPALHADDPDEFARLFDNPENSSFPVGKYR